MLAGCSAPPPVSSEPPPVRRPPLVRITPDDHTTNIGDRPLRVVIESARAIDVHLVQALAERVSLRAWPERTAIAASVVPVEVAGHAAAVELHATARLPDRWVAIEVAPLPAALMWDESAPSLQLPDGARIARVRTGSEPTVASIELCEEAPSLVVTLRLSEPVEGDAMTALTLHADAGARCEVAAGAVAGAWSWRCTGVDATLPLEITIAAGLRGRVGRPLAPRHLRFTPATLSEDARHCRLLRP